MTSKYTETKSKNHDPKHNLIYSLLLIVPVISLMLPLILILTFLGVNGFIKDGKYYPFIVMILLFPMTALRRKIMAVKEPRELDPFLKQVGILTLMMAVLLAFGLNYF